jgi:hypothetical protein
LATSPISPAVQAPVNPLWDKLPAMPGANISTWFDFPRKTNKLIPTNIQNNCPKNPNAITWSIPSSVNASRSLVPPTINTPAKTIGIPPNNKARIVGPGLQSLKIIPAALEINIAKKICGKAIMGLTAPEMNLPRIKTKMMTIISTSPLDK